MSLHLKLLAREIFLRGISGESLSPRYETWEEMAEDCFCIAEDYLKVEKEMKAQKCKP
jgi:hypothetical protein